MQRGNSRAGNRVHQGAKNFTKAPAFDESYTRSSNVSSSRYATLAAALLEVRSSANAMRIVESIVAAMRMRTVIGIYCVF